MCQKERKKKLNRKCRKKKYNKIETFTNWIQSQWFDSSCHNKRQRTKKNTRLIYFHSDCMLTISIYITLNSSVASIFGLFISFNILCTSIWYILLLTDPNTNQRTYVRFYIYGITDMHNTENSIYVNFIQ